MIKLTLALVLAGFFELSAKTYAQEVTINRKDASLETVLKDIQQQTSVFYYCEAILFKQARPVSIYVTKVPFEEVLRQFFLNQSLTYEIQSNVIIVTRKDERGADTVFALRGRILNEQGQPLVGATVQVKGVNTIVVSDERGMFDLSGVDPQATIVVTSVGYKTEEVRLQGRRYFQVRLNVAVNNLDQVQVIGYGTTTKRMTTGSVSKVTAEEIERQPVSNPLAAISGRMAGVYIQQGTGVTNGNFNIKIRGVNSLRPKGNNPLYIVDGVPFTSTSIASAQLIGSTQQGNPLSNIDPSEISSIEILKDADATAIYGSRGANGVVLITTKRSASNIGALDVSVAQGISKAPRRLKLLNTQEYLQLRREAFVNDGGTPNELDDPDLLLWDTTRYTDWQKALIGGTGNITNAQVSYGGGGDKTTFNVGGGFVRESTVFPGDFADQKLSLHLSLNNTSFQDRLKMTFTVNFMSDNNDQMLEDLTAKYYLPPNAPAPFDSLGNINWEKLTWVNPYASVRQHYLNNTETFLFNGTAVYKLAKGLNLKLNAGYTSMYMSEKSLFPSNSINPRLNIDAHSIIGNSSIRTVIAEPQLEYSQKFGFHELSVLIGSTYHQDKRFGQSFSGIGFASDELIENLSAATNIYPQENIKVDYLYAAIFARINYDWKKKIIINLTGRRDGSSRFSPQKQYANFGAIGVAWIFSEEPWARKRFPFLSFGKIRSSFGVTGNDQIPDYGYLDLWYPFPYRYNGNLAFVPLALSNPNFEWERNRKAEASIDLGFSQNRVLLSVSYYQNQSSNQLVGIPLPLAAGIPNVQGNLPATVRNEGWEVELQTAAIKSSAFEWTTSMNLTLPKNKLISYPNIETSSYSDQYKVGEPVTTFKSYQFLGVNPQTGIFEYSDVNKDGLISFPQDAISYKDLSQSIFGGIDNSFRFGRLQLSFFIQGVRQTGRNFLSAGYPAGISGVNQPIYYRERWTAAGEVSPLQKATHSYSSPTATAFFDGLRYGDQTVIDASFLRIKNLFLSYVVPLKTSVNKKILGTVFLQAQNLLTITGYRGIDPETQSFSALPPLKVVTIGFKLKL